MSDLANKLQAKIKTYKKQIEEAKKEAATLANTCMCNLIKEHDAAVKATNKKNQDANKKAWTQAAHIRCVVDSVPMAKCKVGKPPVVVPAKLAAGVMYQAALFLLLLLQGVSD